jgi:hypothetical protein
LGSSGILVSDERKVDKIRSYYALVEAPHILPELNLPSDINSIQIRSARASACRFLIAVNIAKLPSVPRQILKDIPRPPNTASPDD